MAREAAARVHDLLGYGVPFDRDLAGHLPSPARRRIPSAASCTCSGDMPGAAIMAALVEAVAETPSIRVLAGYIGESLLTDGGRVTGIVARPRDGLSPPVQFPARAVVLATGGIGHLYAVTTNPVEADGGGLAMVARAGAVIADPEFVQFHPTAFDFGRDPAPLATEALRGEGATLIDRRRRTLHADVHPIAELAPRDIVARAVYAEIAAGRGAFLDAARPSARDSPRRSRPFTAIASPPASIRRAS